ncbi:MAG: hydratase, partial [Deltaproteobacteria bacterium]|nr:hydratase [Deltaproteobacteria bacterium]
NPLKLAEYTLSRKDPGYVARAKEIQKLEKIRLDNPETPELLARVREICACADLPETLTQINSLAKIGLGSIIFAMKPGDGSAREQAASCQKVLGGWANLAREYATERYRSNLINWGMLPFVIAGDFKEYIQHIQVGAYLVIPDLRQAVEQAQTNIQAWITPNKADSLKGKPAKQIYLTLQELTQDERQIILSGSLINFYNKRT